MRLHSLDGRKEFEDHKKDENEADYDDGIDVSFDADKFGEAIAQFREKGNHCHASPDDDADGKLEKRLSALAMEESGTALPNHEDGECEDSDLVKVELHRDRISMRLMTFDT